MPYVCERSHPCRQELRSVGGRLGPSEVTWDLGHAQSDLFPAMKLYSDIRVVP